VPPLEERVGEAKGTRLRYFVGGDGPPIVLIHGLGGAACNWTAVVRLLAPGHRLLVPELPGHGGSSALPVTPTLDCHADRVAAVLEREELGQAIVAGHSLGALVAVRLACRAPAVVAGVVLAGAAGISSRSRRARAGLTVSTLVKPGRRLAPHRDTIARRPRLRRGVLFWGVADTGAFGTEATERFLVGPGLHLDTASAARALVLDDVREPLAGVRVPSLVLWGARDSQVPVADAFEFARRLRAPLRVIADCGHLLIGERPDACADAIAGLASSVGSARS
jgi:3-oxoadipate enol-lactonase